MSNVHARTSGRRFDWVLFALICTLAFVGLMNLRSAAEVAGSRFHITQMVRMLLGAGIAGVIAYMDYRIVERWAYVILGGVALLLLAVFPFGTELNNSTRWLDLGVFLLQPSELMKIAVIIATARYFHDHEEPEGHGFNTLIAPTLLAAGPCLLVVLEPDLGTSITIFLIYSTICFFEGIRRTTMGVIFGAGLISAPLMWLFGMKQYQRDRVIAFLNPTENLQGDAWQVTQSRIAIGSGRMFGKGYLQGTQVQNGFVPEHENDFIFAHHGEQFGFVGSVALLLLYFAIIVWALRIARYGRDRFAVLCAVGVASFFFWHVLVNIGMVTGMLPVVGLWLPLASYGGSSVLAVMSAVGLLMSISMRRQTF